MDQIVAAPFLVVPVPLMEELPVDASALAFLEEAEEKDLAAEYLELARAASRDSLALVERLREVVRWRHVLRQKGRGRKKKRRGRRDDVLVPLFYALLRFTVDTSSCLGPGSFLGRIPHIFFVMVVLALYALGNLDFLRATGIWHPLVRCLSRWRSTRKFGVFWEMTKRYSTTLCI